MGDIESDVVAISQQLERLVSRALDAGMVEIARGAEAARHLFDVRVTRRFGYAQGNAYDAD